MENFPKGENLYLCKGATYGDNGGGGGGGNGNNNKGNGGYDYGGDYGGGNGPRKGLRREPRKILLTEKKEIPLRAPNAKRNACGGNKHTYQYLTRLKKATKRKTRGGLPATQKQGPHTDREEGRPKKK